MKILQLCPRTPFPPDDGGRISMYNVTRHLAAQGADITLLSFHDEPFVDEVRQFDGITIRYVALQHNTRNTATRILKSLFNSEALYLSKHHSESILQTVLGLFSAAEFDWIHADHTAMAPLGFALAKHWNKPLGLRLHNVEWKIWQRYADTLPWWKAQWIYIRTQAKKLRRDEAGYISNATVAFPISENDLVAAQELAPNAHLVCVRAGVNSVEWKAKGSVLRDPNTIVMASAWAWKHNVDGARWFLDQVYTPLHTALPATRLVVPGARAPELFSSYAGLKVECPGYVESMPPVYNAGVIFVAPLFVGSGVRIKIIEAMAAGLVVVSTAIGAEGIQASEEHGLFRCDSAEEQRRCIEELLRNHNKREMLQKKAAEFVSEHYEWRDQIEIIYKEYAKSPAHPAAS